MNADAQDWLPRHRLTVDDYYRMAEVGVLAPDARVELIEGEIIDMPPIGSPHGGMVNALTKWFVEATGETAVVSVQSPMRLSRRSEPQPDLLLLKPRADFYGKSHPTAVDVLLLVEVSDSTVRYDREIKIPLYARHGVTEVWIIDVSRRTLDVCRSPASTMYRDVQSFSPPERVIVAALPHVTVELADLFDPA